MDKNRFCSNIKIELRFIETLKTPPGEIKYSVQHKISRMKAAPNKPSFCGRPFRSELTQFMEARRIKMGDTDTPITNTRIGTPSGSTEENKIIGGKYNITDEDYEQFLNLVHKEVIVGGTQEYYTEKQFKDGGPICVDFDFQFSKGTMERQYNEGHIQQIVDMYTDILGECYQLIDPNDEEEEEKEGEVEGKKKVSGGKTVFAIMVFEKPVINRMFAEKKGIVKDGLHFIITLDADETTKILIREKAMERLPPILSDMNLTNSMDKIIDEGICNGNVAWNVYGCRKPLHDSYELTHIFGIGIDYEEARFRAQPMDLGIVQLPRDMILLSARNRNNPQLWFRDDFAQKRAERLENAEEEKERSKEASQLMLSMGQGGGGGAGGLRGLGLRRPGSAQGISTARIMACKNMEEINALYDIYYDNLDKTVDQEIIETLIFLFILPADYYEKGTHMKRIKVCWALYHISDTLLIAWIKFVYQREDKDFTRMGEWVDMWNKSNANVAYPITKGSLRHWAKQDNPVGYDMARKQTLDFYVEQTLRRVVLENLNTSGKADANKSSGDDDYGKAFVLYHMYKDDFVCVSTKNNIWYQYYDNYWHEIEAGTTLRLAISNELRDLYVDKAMRIKIQLAKIDPDHENYAMLKKRANMILEMANKMGKTTDKKHVMQEAADLFYDPNFMDKLDTQPHLLCCKNGVMDFKEGVFRRGYPEDYLSKCTGVNYLPLCPKFIVRTKGGVWSGVPTEEQLRLRDEIYEFMRQLFPIPELCKYMLQHLASLMHGDTALTQSMHLYVGSGSNGKSTLVDALIASVMGTYKVDLPVSFYTTERGKQGSATPEIMKLVGARLAISPEPSKGETMIEGPMKQLTSGIDMMQGRDLYDRRLVSFRPQCHPVMCTNNRPIIKATDNGTWRRIKEVPFVAYFCDNPVEGDPFKPYQFKKRDNLNEKMESWKETFHAMLIETCFETGGKVESCEIVETASREYRAKQDVISEFIVENIVPDKNALITKSEIQQLYTSWYRGLYGQGGPGITDVHEALDRSFGNYNRLKKGWVGVRAASDHQRPSIFENGQKQSCGSVSRHSEEDNSIAPCLESDEETRSVVSALTEHVELDTIPAKKVKKIKSIKRLAK